MLRRVLVASVLCLVSIAGPALAESPDWLSSAQRTIAEDEYEVTWQTSIAIPGIEAAWHAPNRAHDLRTYFTDAGIRVVRRTETEPTWVLGLEWVGYGRGGRSWPVSSATTHVNGARVDYRRGAVSEWYENSHRGLKQGFALAAPPEEVGAKSGAEPSGFGTVPPGRFRSAAVEDPIHLDLALSGGLRPLISEDGQAIDFEAPGRARVVRYAELEVTDASGAELPAWMEGFAGPVSGVRIVIDDSGAVYPITVDPLATSPAWTAESDQDGAEFGYSVATAGDVNGDGYSDVIVGAPYYDNGQMNEGRAYIYLGSPSGLSAVAAWTAESDQASAYFGYSVATAGDVNGDGYSDVIVGANACDNGQTDEGRAYVYLGSVTGPSTTPAWTAESNQAGASFGYSVATAGDVNGDGYSDVIVGAISYDNGQPDEGRAFVYLGSASGLAASPAWTAESNQASGWFGTAAGTAGDVNGDGYADVIVGASNYTNGQTSEGRAYVYLGSASGLAASPAWTAESNQGFSAFGVSAGTAGDVNGDGYADVIVGANDYDNGEASEGRAYVYLGSASGLAAAPAWTAESNQAAAHLGFSVGTAGDVNGDGYADVIVGAYLYDNGETNEGRAYVYLGSASGLAAAPVWTAESDQADARFGVSVGTAGDVNGDGFSDPIVGAYWHDNVQGNEGRAFAYLGGPSGPAATAGWTAEGDQAGASLGGSVGTAGDVNGDGYADVIVSAGLYDSGQPDEGRAYVFLGSATGLSAPAAWTAEGDQAYAEFGGIVGTAGDVNGDGYADVIVAASAYDNGQTDEGRAYVYLGSAAGLSATAAWTAEGDQAEAYFGTSVAAAGDVNGDGYSDVIVGASAYDNGQTDEGRAYVYLGSVAGLSATAAWTAEGDQEGADFGSSVATAGDVNGDGYSDVIVGASSYDNGQRDEGRAFVFLGSAAGLAVTAAWTAESNQDWAHLGNAVGSAGDVNGDGYSDAVIGAPDFTLYLLGRVYVYLGSASGLATAPEWTAEGATPGDNFGASVGTAGDVNGDGFSDLIVGAYAYEGRAYVHLGSASGLSPVADWLAEGGQADGYFGYSVGTAGDVNGDGYADVVVGAPGYESGQTNEGRTFLYYGGGGRGLPLLPRQLRLDDTAPIAPLGMGDDPSSFRLALQGRTPFGRGRVRLEWEAKTLGTLLDGTGLSSAPGWDSTGTTGVDLDGVALGFSAGDRAHWRARLLHDPVTVPFQPHGRWVSVPSTGWQEADLRTRLRADFGVTQVDLADPVLAGETYAYSIDVQNLGPDAAPGLLGVTLPAGSTFVSAEGSGFTCVHEAVFVRCEIELQPAGAHRTLTVTIVAGSNGAATNTARVSSDGRDEDRANDVAIETTSVLVPGIGDFVWQDSDADGIQDPGEYGQPGTIVALYLQDGTFLGTTITDADGVYSFTNLTYGEYYYLRFFPPEPWVFSPADRGPDDSLDSDADPVTGRTITFRLYHGSEPSRWDAGLKRDGDGDGYTVEYGDCDDGDASVHPGAPQLCDAKNNDCSDPAWPAVPLEEQDRDGDGLRFCNGDCSDTNPNMLPGHGEACNGFDDDCDGRVDDGCDAACDLPGKLAPETDLSPSSTNAIAPKLTWTGGSYGVVFSDSRDGNIEIYFARFDASLNKIGSDVRVTNSAGISTAPQMAWNGTDYGVVWSDERDGDLEIYFARLSASGVNLSGDVRVTSTPGVSRLPRIAWSGSDWGVLWTDRRDGTWENYFVRLDEWGRELSAERRLSAIPFDSHPGRFAWNGAVYGVVYHDVRDGDLEIYFQTIDRDGNPVTPETRLTTAVGVSRTPAIAWDGTAGQFGVAWVDDRSGADELFFTRVAADGTKLTGEHPLASFVNTVTIAHSGGEWALAWSDQGSGNLEIYFARLALDALNGAPVRVTDDPASDQVYSLEWTGTEYAVGFAANRAGETAYHPYAARLGCCTASDLGDRAWNDADRDGIQDPGEAGVEGVLVALFDGAGDVVDATETGSDGGYGFTGLSCGTSYSLRFFPPTGYFLSPRDQGGDDTLDSDADPATGETATFVLGGTTDAVVWDAGMHACWAPDEPVYIYAVGRTSDGNNYPILNFEDPNQPGQITGYNVYRSSDPGLPWPWPLFASDVLDMDEAAPNKQWVDTSGDVPPSGIWYYQVTAYNHRCPAEGPR